MSTSTVIVLVVIGILIVWAIGVYNSLVSMRQRVNQAYADIDVQLQTAARSGAQSGGNSEGLCGARARHAR